MLLPLCMHADKPLLISPIILSLSRISTLVPTQYAVSGHEYPQDISEGYIGGLRSA
jgi:hypothetical protein